jgi:hypothetical protein
LLLLTLAGAAHAHVRNSTGYSDVRGEGSTVRYELAGAWDGNLYAFVED